MSDLTNFDNVENINEYPWLLFKLFGVTYAVSSKQITAITNLPNDITKIPEQSYSIRGVMEFRGEHIKIIDTREIFNIVSLKDQISNATEKELERLHHIDEMTIVFEADGDVFGIAVDEVMSVDEITLLNGNNMNNSVFRSKYINGIGKTIKTKELVLIFDHTKLTHMD